MIIDYSIVSLEPTGWSLECQALLMHICTLYMPNWFARNIKIVDYCFAYEKQKYIERDLSSGARGHSIQIQMTDQWFL